MKLDQMQLKWRPLSAIVAGYLFLSVVAAQLENARVGIVDFYAYGDLDPQQIRAALSIRAGEKLVWPGTRDRIRDGLTRIVGRPFTHFAPVCCDKDGLWMLYVGFGDKAKDVAVRPQPTAELRLAPELTQLFDQYMAMLPDSLKHAAGTPEDYSRGYSLASYPPMRAIQLRMRGAALAQEGPLLHVLVEAADDRQRIAASALAGHTRQSPLQIAALVEASRDRNATVRNNATRALAVLAATPELARQIPARPFIEKLNSSAWSDRNKGLMLLVFLTRDRNPEILAALKNAALPALMEMAQWQNPGHAAGPIRLLGRIAGIDERELDKLAESGNAGPVLAAVRKQP